ncbi:MAG: uncharacterized protein A8A55_2739, partial [Amphiamblys sp. WSBS2006]
IVDTQENIVRVESQNTQAVFQLPEQKLFFVSFPNGEFSVQAVPKGIAEVSVLEQKENSIEYIYKKEKDHGSLFDSFLITEECKYEDSWKTPIIKNIPRKRKEAALLLPFLAAKGFQLNLEEASGIHGEEESKYRLKIPYGVSLFITEENSCCLKLFDLTNTKIKKLAVASFDITEMNLKNTTIEELFLLDEMAVEFSYNSIGRSGLCVEKFSFGMNVNPGNESFLKLLERVHKGESVAVRKIKMFVLNRNSFFDFLKEARIIPQKEIHIEDLFVTQNRKDSGHETSTRIVVSKKISIKGNPRVLLFIELGPEINYLDIASIQRQCRSLRTDIPRINIALKENKIIIKESLYGLQFLKKNIAATEVCFFGNKGKNELLNTKIKHSLLKRWKISVFEAKGCLFY